MSERASIKEIKLLETGSNIFCEYVEGKNVKYEIPLYQREFAWEYNQIEQLIEDIYDFEGSYDEDSEIKHKKYYLGSLIVQEKEETENDIIYEVIDGQQRLTTLFLLFQYLGIHTNNDVLVFKCREKSNYTLRTIANTENFIEKLDLQKDENWEANIINGVYDIDAKFKKIIADPMYKTIKLDEAKQILKHKLERVILYRVKVPPHTDLNKYFVRMNTRGEQLEQQDILKANLLENISGEKMSIYADIWDACSNMDGYVQMHLPSDKRIALLGMSWNRIGNNEISNIPDTKNIRVEKTLGEILRDSKIEYEKIEEDNDNVNINNTYTSIIKFPYFLLHVLKIFKKENGMTNDIDTDGDREMLNEYKLVETFKIAKKDFCSSEPNSPAEFSLKFFECMLKCRILFDNYIIKRKYTSGNSNASINSDDNGEWSLEYLIEDQKKPERKVFDNNFLMLQAAARVSFTSPKIMHWLTDILAYLYEDKSSYILGEYSNKEVLKNKLEKIIVRNINNNYLAKEDFSLGVGTPHIVLNYIDYLLWSLSDEELKETYKIEYGLENKFKFKFEFRNSVEHWYPQHPNPISGVPTWENKKELDQLGNLCLIQRDVNASLSNNSPETKSIDWKEKIAKGSLKLRIMAKELVAKKTADEKASDAWRERICSQHTEEIKKLLIENCQKILTLEQKYRFKIDMSQVN